jgi:hypothetical protein
MMRGGKKTISDHWSLVFPVGEASSLDAFAARCRSHRDFPEPRTLNIYNRQFPRGAGIADCIFRDFL